MNFESTAFESTDFETLAVEIDGALGRLTLNRPDRLNALGPTLLTELVEAARFFDRHLEVRVVILRGAGRAFSAGADLKAGAEAAKPKATPPPEWQVRREAGQLGLRVMGALEQMRAVTVAQVQGYAVGGGFLLMLACDLRVVAEDARFFIPEVDLGLPLAWGGVPRMVREIGPALTRELVMTCRRFSAREAQAWGMVNRVVPAADLERVTEALAREVLEKPAGPLVMTKDQVNAATEAMAPATTAWADGDALQSAVRDPAAAKARQRYLERTFRPRTQGSQDPRIPK